MSPLDLILIAAAGGVGAGARYLLDGLVMRGRREAFPVGILIVNAIGSFLLGLLTGIAPDRATWLTLVGVGALGGFTTFSTVSVDTVRLARRGRRDWAWTNLLGTFAVCVVAAAIGFFLAGLLPS